MTEAADKIREWMLQTLAAKGWTARAWATRAGVAPSTVAKAVKPDYPFVTSTRTLNALAAAAGVSPPGGETPARSVQLVPTFLAVRYVVQAGLWKEVDEAAQTYIDEFSYPVTPDARFADWPQWLEQVQGDSVNKIIPPGGLAHVVDAIEMGYSPRPNDFVVVERRRDQGRLRERTIKQVEIGPDRSVALRPCSTNPKWADQTILARHGERAVTRAGTDAANDDVEVEIVGLVIGSYNKIV